MIVYAAPFLGLPELIAGSRLCSTEQIFILAVVVIPVDLAAGAIALTPGRRVLPLALAAGVAVIYVGTRQLGIFHGYLYYELTRYNAAVMVTQDITDKFPENSYTIVSTTDELYQVIEQGRHEELLTFLNRVNGSGYTDGIHFCVCGEAADPIRAEPLLYRTGLAGRGKIHFLLYDLFQRGEQHQCLGDLAGAGREGDDDVLKTLADLFQSGQPHDTGIQSVRMVQEV